MKKTPFALAALLTVMLALFSLAACTPETPDISGPTDVDAPFSYSDGIDENGYYKDIKALDYIELFDYDAFPIPADVQKVSDEDVQAQIDSILANFAYDEEVTDRAIQDGDNVNIDFVGTVDGVEFDGGSTNGEGADIIVGQTSYIDDFIEQLIGHSIGDVFDIEVTFPVDYGVEELNGKDAIFNITINRISQTVTPELTNEFVMENINEYEGWETTKEFRDGIRDNMKDNAIMAYIQDYLVYEVMVKSLPESVLKLQERALVYYYESYAVEYAMELDDFLTTMVGVASVDALVEQSQGDIRNNTVYTLVVQAVAEDAGITVTEDDVAAHFLNTMGSEDYSSYEEDYGLPYLKQTVLGQMVLDRILENAVMK